MNMLESKISHTAVRFIGLIRGQNFGQRVCKKSLYTAKIRLTIGTKF